MITSGSSPPCSLVAMDSPLFYELQDHCHDVSPVKNNNQRQRSASNLHLNLNNNTLADVTSARGLAPIRVPQTGAVFGNAPGSHPQQQQLAEASYPELADINTPEISLDLQVNFFKYSSSFFKVISFLMWKYCKKKNNGKINSKYFLFVLFILQ